LVTARQSWHLRLLDVTRAAASKAAQVRAAPGLKTPDAILVATVALHYCALVGNDHTRTRKHLGITCLYPGDYLD
jgi:predicted nucleic acid-binding protein